MGCTIGKDQLVLDNSQSLITDCIFDHLIGGVGDDTFSERSKYLLRETWKTLSVDRIANGIKIFQQIFISCPEAKNLFSFKNLSGDELLQNSLFRMHAVRFIHAIDAIVQSLDALDIATIPVLHRLGKAHVWIVGFHMGLLPTFLSALLQVFGRELGKRFTQEVHDAWFQLAKFITTHMIRGYNEAMEERDSLDVTQMNE